jgi:nucleotide-binding universal stress UspA family protein
MSIRKILVPVDYSECSRVALRFAADLAERYGAAADIVHVWDRPSYVTDVLLTHKDPLSGKSLVRLIEENAEHDLEEFLKGTELPHGMMASGRLLSGDPASALLRELEQGQHDMVVMGTHGRGGLSHLLLGSVAEKLTRLARVPVLVVPDDAAKGKRS